MDVDLLSVLVHISEQDCWAAAVLSPMDDIVELHTRYTDMIISCFILLHHRET